MPAAAGAYAAAPAPVVPVHRFMGATYVASATSLGVTGLILAPTAYTGLVGSAGFTILDLAMLFTTWTAVRMILAGRYGEHRRSMIRSFSLIMAGVMLRVWTPIYDVLAAVGIRRLLLRDGVRRDFLVSGSRTSCSRSGSPATQRRRIRREPLTVGPHQSLGQGCRYATHWRFRCVGRVGTAASPAALQVSAARTIARPSISMAKPVSVTIW